MEVVVLQVPNRLLLRVGVRPDGHAVVLALLRAAVRAYIGDLRNVPDSNAAFNARSEQQVLAWRLPVCIKNARLAEQRPSVASQRQIGLQFSALRRGGLLVLAVQVRQIPQLDHAVFRDRGHGIDTWNKLDSPNNIHVTLKLVLLGHLSDYDARGARSCGLIRSSFTITVCEQCCALELVLERIVG